MTTTPLTDDLRTLLHAAVDRHDLRELSSHLEAIALLSIVATPGEPLPPEDDSTPAGRSRLGGLPDLREGSAWPSSEGKLLRFVAQINLAELPASHLPARGLLSFFVGPDEPAKDVDHRVLFTSDRVTRVSAPARGSGDWHHLPPLVPSARLTFAATVSLPSPDSFAVDDATKDRLATLRRELLPECTRLLGYPEPWSGDVSLDGYLCRAGHKDIVYTRSKTPEQLDAEVARAWEDSERDQGARAEQLESQRESLVWFHNARESHLVEAERWRVLLQVASQKKLDLRFWGAGLLTFLADDRDVAHGDFTRTYATVQSS